MKTTYYHFPTVDSTNAYAKRNKESFLADELAIITTDEQTAGRGRLMRPWYSPKGKNLYLTLAFFAKDFSPFFFSQLASLCLHELLTTYKIDAKIKWPNDLLIG